MKKLLFGILLLGLSLPAQAVTTRMFRGLDTCARYKLKEKDAFEATKDLKLKYNGNDEKEAKLFFNLYFSVFTPNEKVDF